MNNNEIPRRINTELFTPAETAIHQAIQAVEQLEAHPLLTDAVTLLTQAQSKVADHVDHKQTQKSTLENYFALNKGSVIDYTLRVNWDAHGQLMFYIHPQNVNGDTWDFAVNGNELKSLVSN
jgi:hypothetical protein